MLKPWWLLINQFRIYKGMPALKQLRYQWRPDSLTLKLLLPSIRPYPYQLLQRKPAATRMSFSFLLNCFANRQLSI
ncbi:hypothetical protein Scep_021611 [Stephania cephalantha]|uniref:Uncharacterized protein n=1 Tax=Stephania cephalantha TaxID=152367 RepID=A0AAP0F6F8_9MAGN